MPSERNTFVSCGCLFRHLVMDSLKKHLFIYNNAIANLLCLATQLEITYVGELEDRVSFDFVWQRKKFSGLILTTKDHLFCCNFSLA